jgi:hypothetical protein
MKKKWQLLCAASMAEEKYLECLKVGVLRVKGKEY